MKINIKSDLSVLTTIDERSLDRIFDKIHWCISDAVEKAILANETLVEVDLGFGILLINLADDQIRYKFKPSALLEKSLIDTVINERNELVFNIEKNLVSRIENIYKDMF